MPEIYISTDQGSRKNYILLSNSQDWFSQVKNINILIEMVDDIDIDLLIDNINNSSLVGGSYTDYRDRKSVE